MEKLAMIYKLLLLVAFVIPLFGGGPTLVLRDVKIEDASPIALGIELRVSGKLYFSMNDEGMSLSLDKTRIVLVANGGRGFASFEKWKDYVNGLKGEEFEVIQCWSTRVSIEDGKVIEVLIGRSPVLAGN
jgi:hypothetical protein